MDLTKIEGYSESLSADEKLKLILGYEPPEPTGVVKKDVFDRTASELAEAKKQLKAKMTEDEQKEAERIAKEAEKDAKLAQLEKEVSLTKNRAKFLGLGFDDKLAEETALAMSEGNFDKVFENQAKHIENVKKAERASALAGDPKPEAGKQTTTVDYSKEIAEAQSNFDYAKAAMLMRQQQEAGGK